MQPQKLSENKRKAVASLHRKKGRDKNNEILIEGARSVKSAILGKAALKHIVVRSFWLDDSEMAAHLVRAKVPIYVMDDRQAISISSVENGQGILAVAEKKPERLEDLLSLDSIIALDGIQDPGNVGTIIRTAAWFGIEGVLTGSGTADIYHPKTIRATMGGLWDIHCVKSADLAQSVLLLQQHAFKLCGTYLNGKSIQAWTPGRRTVLIMGSEATGISDDITRVINQRITIPGHGGEATESLNAATAASICMYHWTSMRSRKQNAN